MMIEELRTFLAVSAAGSIQGASRHLPLTQSAITRQIQRLEEELGCVLLDRSVKPPRLTRDGEQVQARGKLLVDEVTAFKESFDPTAEPAGMLRLGVAHAALDWRGSSAIAQAIVELTHAYPKVSVRLSAGWTPRLLNDLNDGTLDAALVIGRSGATWPAGATVLQVGADQLIAVASRTIGVNRLTAFPELFERAWILNPDGCGYRALLLSLATSIQRTIHVIAEVQGASLQRELIASGLGVGLIPEGIARAWQSHHEGRTDLIVVKPKGRPFDITANLVSTATTQRLRRPIERIGLALNKVFARRRDGSAR
jgi:DNA-binding transcriptional LysR family regulator